MTTTLTQTTTAREYLRVSKDRSGEARSTTEQHAENAAAVADEGWVLHGEPYLDNDRSASKFARKAREGFDQLIEDLRAGRFDADVLIMWELSRGSRRASEGLLLVELLEESGVLVYSTSDDRTFNPAHPRDRKTLLEAFVDSEYDSAKTSLRNRRTSAHLAAAGKPNGPTPWGYRREYEFVTIDGRQKRVLHQYPDPDTAPLVRELFERANGGHSLRSIEKDWQARGIVNRSGNPFTAQHLRSLLFTRAYVGDRVHNPGSKDGNDARNGKGQVVPGTWEPLVDRATFNAVQLLLSDPQRVTRRPGRGIHLLSMIAACDVCGGPLTVRYSKRTEGAYQCQRASHVHVPKPELDLFAEDLIVGFLSDPERYQRLSDAEDDSAALVAARAEVSDIQAELADLGDQVGSGAMSATLAARAEPGILKRLKEAEAREQALGTPSRLRNLIEPGPGARGRWEAAPMSTRREVARILLSPDMLGELRVVRSPGRGTPVKDRVEWRTARLPR